MKWKSIYLDKVYTSDSSKWSDLPDNILCVIIYNKGIHRLIGADYYWVKDNSYGMIYDGSCCDVGQVWWKDKERMIEQPPKHISLKAGLMLPDSDWEKFMEKIDAYT